MFLTGNLTTQVGTFALVPQVVDAVKVPVVAAGGIADARGIVAALALGASAVQIGTAYLFCPESRIQPPHRAALASASDDGTAVTNLQTGKPARGLINRVMRELGPVNDVAPEFPLAGGALAPLNVKALSQGSGDFLSMREFSLSAYDAGVLVAERETAEYFEGVARGRDAKAAANWVINELFGRLNKEGKDIGSSPVSADQLGTMLDLIADGTISGKIAKDLFEVVWQEGGDPRAVVEQRGMKQVTDIGAIEKVIDDIIARNPDKVADARTNPKVIGWFVGQAMKASGGKASPQAVNDVLKRKLGLLACNASV